MQAPLVILAIVVLGAIAVKASASPAHEQARLPPLLPPAPPNARKKARKKPLVTHSLKLVTVLYPPEHEKASKPVLTKKRDQQGKIVLGKDGKPILIPLQRATVTDSPELLCARASEAIGRPISLEAYVLATMLPSEIGGKYLRGMNETESLRAKIAVGWVARNKATSQSVSLRELLIPYAFAGGNFGEQTYKVYASTRLPPSIEDVEAAEAVLRAFEDPTKGALHFDAPRAQDELWSKGRVDKNAEEVAQARMKEGLVPVAVPGIDINILRLWRRRSLGFSRV